MSIFLAPVKGLSKAASFLLNLFTKTAQVGQMLSKLSPSVVAAMLAVFYDVMKTAQAAIALGAAVKEGDIPSTFTLGATTLALVEQVAKDAIAGEQLVVADLKQLGHATDSAPAVAA